MVQPVGIGGKYAKKSFEGERNFGSHGKLNQDQMEERAALHARRVATGDITINGIALHWKKKYNIDISYNSEREWASTNEDRIQRKLTEMVENGQIQLETTNMEVAANTFYQAIKDNGRLVQTGRKKIKSLIEAIKHNQNYLEDLGYTVEKYSELDSKDQKIVDRKLKAMDSDRRYKISLAKSLSEITEAHSKILTQEVKLFSELVKQGQIQNHKVERLASERAKKKIAKHVEENNTEMDLVNFEVTEEMRKQA